VHFLTAFFVQFLSAIDTNTQMEMNALPCTDNFLYGYKLGVLMTMEVLNGMDDLILGKGDK